MRGAAEVLSILIAGGAVACAARSPAGGSAKPPFPYDKTAYYNEGKILMLGLGVLPSRLAGPAGFLPVEIVVANKDKREIVLDRESFTLELPDRTLVPLATYRDFRDGYSRAPADTRIGEAFLDSIGGRFPIPPFRWLSLDFFPLKTSSVAPRGAIALRFADVGFGFLYFRMPRSGVRGGVYKLLVAPKGADATYVVDFAPYRNQGGGKP